jgi:hypothetical protein
MLVSGRRSLLGERRYQRLEVDECALDYCVDMERNTLLPSRCQAPRVGSQCCSLVDCVSLLPMATKLEILTRSSSSSCSSVVKLKGVTQANGAMKLVGFK